MCALCVIKRPRFIAGHYVLVRGLLTYFGGEPGAGSYKDICHISDYVDMLVSVLLIVMIVGEAERSPHDGSRRLFNMPLSIKSFGVAF